MRLIKSNRKTEQEGRVSGAAVGYRTLSDTGQFTCCWKEIGQLFRGKQSILIWFDYTLARAAGERWQSS